jgi:carboxyl-terminal processing protease
VIRGDETLTFTVRRAPLVVPTVEFGITQPGVGYLRIPDFEEDIPGLVEEALNALLEEGASTIVIDLRDNPGGFIDAAVEVASMFIPDGIVLVTTSTEGTVEHQVSREALAPGLRLVVMVNRGPASAAAILAGALRDRRGAVLVGTPTFGKQAIQIAFDLRNGGELDLTIAHWTTPEGSSPGNGGLLPDRELEWEAGMSVERAVAAALKASS